jgi:hypothetical protein
VTNQLKFKRAVADAEAPGFAVTNAIDGDTSKGAGRTISGRAGVMMSDVLSSNAPNRSGFS